MTNEQKQLKERLAAYFDEHFEEILADMSEIMSIDSSYGTPSEGKPFGARDALWLVIGVGVLLALRWANLAQLLGGALVK